MQVLTEWHLTELSLRWLEHSEGHWFQGWLTSYSSSCVWENENGGAAMHRGTVSTEKTENIAVLELEKGRNISKLMHETWHRLEDSLIFFCVRANSSMFVTAVSLYNITINIFIVTYFPFLKVWHVPCHFSSCKNVVNVVYFIHHLSVLFWWFLSIHLINNYLWNQPHMNIVSKI